MASFENWAARGLAPPWLRGRFGESLMRAIGAAHDDEVARLRAAVLAKMPSYAPVDALPRIGADRQIDRGVSQTDNQYRESLLASWDLWELAGSHTALHRALYTAGYTGALIVNQLGVGSRWDAAAGKAVFFSLGVIPWRGKPGLYIDGNDALWSRFAIVFSGDPGNLRNEAEWNSLRAIVRKWKSSKSVFVGASIVMTGAAWDVPSSTWDEVAASGRTWGESRSYWIPGEPFAPESVAGVVDWYDADGLGLPNGASVLSWVPRVGSHTLTGIGTTKPTASPAAVNGHGAVAFTESGYLQTATFADIAGPIDVLVVATVTGAPGSIWALINGGAAGKEIQIARTYLQKTSIRNTIDVATAADMPSGWHLFHARFEGGSRSHLWVDNDHALCNVDAGPVPVLNGITVGARYDGGLRLVGYVAEAVVAAPLSSNDWTATREYLRTKYRTP